MRHQIVSRIRIAAATVVILIFAVGVSAAPRDERGPREKNPIVKVVKKVIKSLGDGLTIPRP